MKLYNFSEYPVIQSAIQEYANFGTINDLSALLEALQEVFDEIKRLKEIEWMHTDVSSF